MDEFGRAYNGVLKKAGINSAEDFVEAINGGQTPAEKDRSASKLFDAADQEDSRPASWSSPSNPESPSEGAKSLDQLNTGMQSGKAASLDKYAFLGTAVRGAAKGVTKGIGKGLELGGKLFGKARKYTKGAQEAVEQGDAGLGQKTWDSLTRSGKGDAAFTGGFGAYNVDSTYDSLSGDVY